jgi:hypothetical protein
VKEGATARDSLKIAKAVWEGGLVFWALLLIQWANKSGTLMRPIMIHAKDRVRRAILSVVGSSPLWLSCTSARCQWGLGPEVSKSAQFGVVLLPGGWTSVPMTSHWVPEVGAWCSLMEACHFQFPALMGRPWLLVSDGSAVPTRSLAPPTGLCITYDGPRATVSTMR